MDNHEFDLEMRGLLEIGQDECQRPVDLRSPVQKFQVSIPDTSVGTELYTEMFGESPTEFSRTIASGVQSRAALAELDRLNKCTDLTSDDVLRKSGIPISKIPSGYQAECLLCQTPFHTKAELDAHDREYVEVHKKLL